VVGAVVAVVMTVEAVVAVVNEIPNARNIPSRSIQMIYASILLCLLMAPTMTTAQGEDNGTTEETTGTGPLSALASVNSCASSIVFIIVAVAVSYLFVLKRREDGTENLPLPEVRNFHPYELAHLRKGITGVIETATISMVAKGEMRVGRISGKQGSYSDSHSFKALRRRPPADNIESGIMANTTRWLPATKYIQTVSRDPLILREVAFLSERLRSESLFRSKAHVNRSRKLAILAILIVLPVPMIKAVSEILYDGSGNICLPVVAIPILMWYYIVAKYETLTALGMRFRDKNSTLVMTMGKDAMDSSPLTEDPVYSVAVYGIASVSCDPRFSSTVNAFTPRPAPVSSSDSGGGCCG